MWRTKLSYFLVFLLTITTVLALPNNVLANNQFEDITVNQEGYDEVNYLLEKGVISGYTIDGKQYYKPQNTVTRAQVAKMVVIASGNTPLSGKRPSYEDVKPGDSLGGYIEKARQLGIFPVSKDNKFYPNEYLTREEMSYVLTKAFNLDEKRYKGLDTIFDDVDKNHPYATTINTIYYSGLAVTSSTFNPKNTLTRSQFALFVARASDEKFRLKLPVEGETNIPEKPNTADVIAIVRSTTNGLNIRQEPKIENNNIIGKVNAGGNLAVYDIQGDWLKVTYNGVFAYISSQYAEYIDAKTRQPLTNVTKKVKANQDLNLYYGATSSSKKITQVGVVPAGTELEVYTSEGGYYQVKYKNIPGYIVGESTTDLTPTPPPVIEEKPKPTPPTTAPSGPTATVGRVTVDYVNVRAQANNQSKQLGQLRLGQRVAVNQISGYWANINFNGQSAWVYKSYLKLLNQNGLPLQNRIIVIDPGHGGKDPGAVSNGYNEKSIVLKVGNLVGQKLRTAGADVRQTRTTDKFLELQEIVDFTNRNEAEIFVSIHVNSFGSSTAHGTETYYSITAGDMYKEDQDLATFINSQIVKNANMYNRGVKTAPYYVTRNVIIPAVLVELGFISNDTDRAKLVSDKYVEIYAESIYQGIVQYYSKQ
ncbi:N-acetylmuramoyl-L-alanine amidase [Metalysinibacillus jejuensis]|uniref:N-acetylmuramoyl-L-alanine amidase n=1 Tax=Metalysinibacillus jejuensis TaxID=914327 RepID=UPI001F1BB703|nr:N-acetylmuramoyl-L-alanine amidase [Metalysinibacillus jejuensis]